MEHRMDQQTTVVLPPYSRHLLDAVSVDIGKPVKAHQVSFITVQDDVYTVHLIGDRTDYLVQNGKVIGLGTANICGIKPSRTPGPIIGAITGLGGGRVVLRQDVESAMLIGDEYLIKLTDDPLLYQSDGVQVTATYSVNIRQPASV